MKRRIVLSLFTGMAVACLLSGCGGSSTSNTTDQSTAESVMEEKDDGDVAETSATSSETLTEDLTEYSDIEWPDSTVTNIIPKPKSMVGKFTLKSDTAIWVEIANTSDDDFKDYIKAAQDMGYTKDYVELDGSYTARNENGYGITIMLDKDHVMSVIADEDDSDTVTEN